MSASVRVSSLSTARIRRLVKEGSWVVIGQIVTAIGGLVLVRILTEYLTPTQYGQLALGLTLAGLINQVVMGGVTAGIGRFYSIAAEKQDFVGYLRASMRLMVYATMAVGGIGLVLMAGLWALGYSQWTGLAAAALVFSVLNGYSSSLSGVQNAARQRAIVAFHSGLDAWLKILLAFGVLLWFGSSSTAVVIGYALSSLFVSGSQLYFLRHLIPRQNMAGGDSLQWTRQIWMYSWPFSAWGVFTWIQQSSDRWALQAFATTEEVGLYAVLYQLGYAPIVLASGIAMSFLGPILYQRSGDASDHSRNANVHRIVWRITLSCLLLTLIGFLLTWSFHEMIFRFLVTAEYRSVSYQVPWVVLAGGLFAAGQILALKMMSDMKSAAMIQAKIVTSIFGIIANFYGAAVAGLSGILFAIVMFSGLYLLWMYFLSVHRLKAVEDTWFATKK